MSDVAAGAGAAAGTGAVHGWGCTPTGEPPESKKQTTLFRGWQRTTLYIILIILMLLVFLNLALTLWIIASLRLSMKGIGPIKIVQGGIELEGQALVTDRLIASTIATRTGQPITLHSHRNFSILVSNPDRDELSTFLIKKDSMECGGRSFELSDARGGPVFKASREEVKVFADALTLEGEGGITVKSAVQTASLRAPPGSDLQLESQTRRLDLRAPQSINLESRAGSIDIFSHSNIRLESTVGAINIEAQNIFLNHLKEAKTVSQSHADTRSKQTRSTKVYQVCVCAKSGKVFLAASDGLCAEHGDDVDLCR